MPRSALAGRPFGPSLCETKSVGEAARVRYAKCFAAVWKWRQSESCPVPRSGRELEALLLKYIDKLYIQGAPAHEAELAVAAVKDRLPQLTSSCTFARVRRALSGFRKCRPHRSRAPVPKEIVGGLIEVLALKGFHELALMVMVMFSTYARPGEVRGLTARQVLRPARRAGPLAHWAITIAPQEDSALFPQALSKTGTMDDTILVDRPSFLGPLLGQRAAVLRPREVVFRLSADKSVAQFKEAAEALGLAGLALYQLRHGGASEDALSRSRTLGEICARGRWRSDSSLRRYAKPAMLHRLLKKLSPEGLAFCQSAWDRVEGLLLRRTAPRPPPPPNALSRRAAITP